MLFSKFGAKVQLFFDICKFFHKKMQIKCILLTLLCKIKKITKKFTHLLHISNKGVFYNKKANDTKKTTTASDSSSTLYTNLTTCVLPCGLSWVRLPPLLCMDLPIVRCLGFIVPTWLALQCANFQFLVCSHDTTAPIGARYKFHDFNGMRALLARHSDLLQLVPPNCFSICWDICLWLFNLTTYRCATQPNPSAKLLLFFHITK